jgi:TetR/AcrR family transcriptional regulator, regulator of cefoperazone and chloramphenicol sensitivity
MKTLRKDSARTSQSLLAAAAEVFGEKGYREATIAEISQRAGTNIAAVNYHFRDKETLYREAWRHSFLQSIKAHPPQGGVSEDAPPEARLRGLIKALLYRVADKNNKEFMMVKREFANPTGLLEEVMDKEIRPLHQRTRVLLLELLGSPIPEQQVQFCEISIISQCLNPMVAERDRADGNRGASGDRPEIDDIEAYAEHVVDFSLGGIGVIRSKAGKKAGRPKSAIKHEKRRDNP